MNYDVFLFDMDGTINESGIGIVNSVRFALEKLGKNVPEESELKKFIGPPLFHAFEDIARLSASEAEEAVKIYRERYSQIGWKENRVYPFITQLLRGIKKRGGRIAICSGKPELFCHKILEYFKLSEYFDDVCAITFTDKNADKEALINRAIPEGTPRDRVIMIGDRVFDYEGAKKTGVDFAAALYGYGTKDEFGDCEKTAETPYDLWDILIGEPVDRGQFITFEGADGSGKSTQYDKAKEYLSDMGYALTVTREPGGCPISEKIRQILLDNANGSMTPITEALLYAAARAQHLSETVIPALERGEIVLCDRYLDSSIAYQGYGRELTEDLVRLINKPATNGMESDLTIIYMLDAKRAHERVLSHSEPDRIEREGLSFTERVNHGYLELAKDTKRVRIVDAGNTIDMVFEETKKILDEFFKN